MCANFRHTALLLLAGIALAASAACSRRSPGAETNRSFRLPEIPAMISGGAERAEYLMAHYWDDFFSGRGACDTSAILGVPYGQVEAALADYILMLENFPMEKARSFTASLFDKIESCQKADTSLRVYPLMTELVCKYLYDPNSPYRSEDYYLPFVEGLCRSPFTLEQARAGYRFQLGKARINPYGTTAPDFAFTDASGRRSSLHANLGEYTILFFSNPGCHACGEIATLLCQNSLLSGLQGSGRLKIISIYIDEDLALWREHLGDYPAAWLKVYDHRLVIRDEDLYYVRAIPSLYLLGPGGKVLLKDPDPARLVRELERQIN